MVTRAELVSILFLCVCLCHVCPASPCGGNPMRSVENFARTNGFESSTQMLHFMKLNTPSDYSSFMQGYWRYLDCTRMVQSGYFKRSADFTLDESEIPSATFSKEQVIDKRDRNHIEQNLVSATVEAKPEMDRHSLVRTEIKRNWDETSESRIPKWREGVAISLEPILDGKTSSFLKRLLRMHEDPSTTDTDPLYKKTDLFTEINSRRR